MTKVKLEETKGQRRLHIGSYFTDLNETDYQELVRIFSEKSRQAAVSGSLPRFSDLIYEDELPEMTDEEYSDWYRKSCVVDGFRMGPIFKGESAFDKANVWKRDYDSRQ